MVGARDAAPLRFLRSGAEPLFESRLDIRREEEERNEGRSEGRRSDMRGCVVEGRIKRVSLRYVE